jgi:hypothetical protein
MAKTKTAMQVQKGSDQIKKTKEIKKAMVNKVRLHYLNLG